MHGGRHPAASGASPGGAVPPQNGVPPPKGPVTSQPIWQSWGAQLDKVTSGFRTQSEKWTQQLQLQAREFKLPKKLGMPVNVEVDVLNPALKTIRGAKDKAGKVIHDTWFSLPTPVQAGLPLLAVGAVGGIIAHRIDSKKLRAEQVKVADLQRHVDKLQEEKSLLQQQVKDLESRPAARDKSPSELEMAALLAEACQAAAAASTAAAQAASACSRPDDGVLPPRRLKSSVGA